MGVIDGPFFGFSKLPGASLSICVFLLLLHHEADGATTLVSRGKKMRSLAGVFLMDGMKQ